MVARLSNTTLKSTKKYLLSTILLTFIAGNAYPAELASHPPKQLIVTNAASWKPFSYVDDEGQARGMLIDLWKLYGRVNHVNITFKLTTLSHSVDLVKHGQADVQGGVLWSKPQAKFMEFGPGLVKIDTQLYIEKQYISCRPSQLFRRQWLGVVKGGYEQSYVAENMPWAMLKSYSTYSGMMAAAEDGDIAGFVADWHVANFYLYKGDNPNAFLPVKHLYHSALRPAVYADNELLLEQIQAGFNAIPEDDIERVYRKWTQVETVYPEYLLPGAIGVLLLSLLLYSLLLRRTVAKKTAQLKKANQLLQHLAETDSLTGICNRRSFLTKLESYCQSNLPLGLMLFDIDRFKGINDNFGHSTGDEVLQILVKRILPVLSDKMVLARIGGEEFCVLIPETTYHDTHNLALDILHVVGEEKFTTEHYQIAVSISMGVLFSLPGNRLSGQLLNEVDRLMYIAKNHGRNCCEFGS
ncbi:sensor domain-containing diguanylate cyclase [Shewanella sp. NFH-SH190041]|uniref:transporter substrate-binding domain-containing diguanylate cyclase n=1 Tax=Shewanella sp. NFH-SH190041 TaxID=2950245 RepID=UPI0021C28E18|nr:diguanylate cyclase [Shewanella sp. NFH-SH190041]BDM64340.1 sensor domain-containing diguanylate cyclase [Shewanella sp. NFH-SH190041]